MPCAAHPIAAHGVNDPFALPAFDAVARGFVPHDLFKSSGASTTQLTE